ncbi:hypothetical protein B0H67DRAFT_143891 [Lasiosphaeris hirsuta]|uniref:Uncharacterized protein n=1 Tax=Lasiosphaeris hirsuta TaxID=260670 RepID=A0AA40B1N4_9PEZI|nr:hypothetical protein B0H67DRAFT_143891 [Lasiosphaeris hirsuta]
MDSLLSAPNYYANLLSEIDMTHSELSEFMLNVRISFIEVDAARRELLSVQTLFEFIDQDSNGYVALIPRDAAKRIAGIVKSCSQVINGVQACIRKHSRPEDEARESTARWLRRGRETITKLTVSLRVHVTSLLVALHVMMLIIARSSNRTNPRRLTNELLKSGGVPVDPNADPIMGSIREHRAMLPNRTNFDLPILYSDVHELSSYAEAIANGSISMPAHQLDEHPGDSPSRPAPKPKSGLKPMIFDEGSDYGSVQNNGSIAETESTEARSPDPPRFSVPDVPTAAECRSGPQSGTMERERRQQHGESGPRAWGGPSGTINDLRLGTPTSPHTPRGYTFEAARYAATPPPRVHNMPRVGSHDQLKHARTSSVGKKSFHHGGVLIRKQSSDPSMGVTGAHLESNAKEGSSHTASSSWRPRQDTPYYETSLPPRSIMQRAAVDDNLWRTQTLPVRRDPRSLRASRSQEQVPRTLGPVPALISMYPTRSAPMPAYPVQLAPTLIYPIILEATKNAAVSSVATAGEAHKILGGKI